MMTPPADGTTVFIGPNNSGKSILLRELADVIYRYPASEQPARWVAGVDVNSSGSAEEFLQWLHERGEKPKGHPGNGYLLYSGNGNGSIDQETS
ncbi:hypothetical protein [Streptomyces sp. NPDC046751]|uniref:hypothetical protein n=1 Tax=unclassified Streptomyces TaxID=2593676 RepID=UPI0033FF7DCA